jgi:hypothetical protein
MALEVPMEDAQVDVRPWRLHAGAEDDDPEHGPRAGCW